MTSSATESKIWRRLTCGRTLLKSDSELGVKFCGKSKPVIHYPVFISIKDRKQRQVSLFSKRIPILILFITFAYVLQSMPSPATAPKMLVGAYQRNHWKLAMTSADAKGVAGISWTTNKSVDAKINILESEGKCSPSFGKSTKHASKFDLQLTRKR